MTAKHILPTDVAFVAGTLLKFFELCEEIASPEAKRVLATHPPAHERWERIRVLTGTNAAPQSMAFGLDGAFDVIIEEIRERRAVSSDS